MLFDNQEDSVMGDNENSAVVENDEQIYDMLISQIIDNPKVDKKTLI